VSDDQLGLVRRRARHGGRFNAGPLGHVWADMSVWLHWVIPIAAFTAAMRFTSLYPQRVRQANEGHAAFAEPM